jgi:hypothetical protein
MPNSSEPPNPFDDVRRLVWLLAQFRTEDNAWHATFCFDVNRDGIRAEIDKQMAVRGTDGN